MQLRVTEYFPGACQSQFIALARKYETSVFRRGWLNAFVMHADSSLLHGSAAEVILKKICVRCLAQ